MEHGTQSMPPYRHIPAFAERTSPSPPMYQLILHTNIARPVLLPLLAQTDVRGAGQRIHPYRHPYRRSTPKPLDDSRSSASSLSPPPSDTEHSAFKALDAQAHPITVVPGLISKPSNVGRLSLEDLRKAMGWNTEEFDEFRVCRINCL